MNIKMIGIDHTRATLDVRQIFSFTKKSAAQAMVWLKEQKGVSGCVVLSTCNRMELWLSCEAGFQESACDVLCRLKQVEKEEYRNYFKCREGEKAVEHLFLLAGGMKSQIVGEDQILTQVKEAAALAREHYCTDQVLEVLFRMAVTAGKKVKTRIPVGKANISAAHQALAALREEGFLVEGKKSLVIGNGEMGRMTAIALKQAGADVTVTVRQYRSGVVNIPEGCARMNYGERYQYIPECDIVFSATASPNVTITKRDLSKINLKKTQIYVDLAVPRDVDPAIGEMPGIRLYDIDSFHIDAQSEEMKRQYEAAKAVVEEQKEDFFSWYECRDLIPKVKNISSRAAEDVAWRTGKTVKNLGLATDRQQELTETIEEAAGKVVGKLMFGLRDYMGSESFRECLEALSQVYGKKG